MATQSSKSVQSIYTFEQVAVKVGNRVCPVSSAKLHLHEPEKRGKRYSNFDMDPDWTSDEFERIMLTVICEAVEGEVVLNFTNLGTDKRLVTLEAANPIPGRLVEAFRRFAQSIGSRQKVRIEFECETAQPSRK